MYQVIFPDCIPNIPCQSDDLPLNWSLPTLMIYTGTTLISSLIEVEEEGENYKL